MEFRKVTYFLRSQSQKLTVSGLSAQEIQVCLALLTPRDLSKIYISSSLDRTWRRFSDQRDIVPVFTPVSKLKLPPPPQPGQAGHTQTILLPKVSKKETFKSTKPRSKIITEKIPKNESLVVAPGTVINLKYKNEIFPSKIREWTYPSFTLKNRYEGNYDATYDYEITIGSDTFWITATMDQDAADFEITIAEKNQGKTSKFIINKMALKK